MTCITEIFHGSGPPRHTNSLCKSIRIQFLRILFSRSKDDCENKFPAEKKRYTVCTCTCTYTLYCTCVCARECCKCSGLCSHTMYNVATDRGNTVYSWPVRCKYLTYHKIAIAEIPVDEDIMSENTYMHMYTCTYIVCVYMFARV